MQCSCFMIHLFRSYHEICCQSASSPVRFLLTLANKKPRGVFLLAFSAYRQNIFLSTAQLRQKHRWNVISTHTRFSSPFRPNFAPPVWWFCLPVSKNVIFADNKTSFLSSFVHHLGFCPLIFPLVCRTMELSNARRHRVFPGRNDLCTASPEQKSAF